MKYSFFSLKTTFVYLKKLKNNQNDQRRRFKRTGKPGQ